MNFKREGIFLVILVIISADRPNIIFSDYGGQSQFQCKTFFGTLLTNKKNLLCRLNDEYFFFFFWLLRVSSF